MKPSAISSGLSRTRAGGGKIGRDGLQTFLRRGRIERFIAVGAKHGREERRLQFAEHDVAVGDGERAATTITCRTGIGPCRVRSHAQAAIEEAADRATAGGDGVDAQHRRTQAHAADGRLQATAQGATEMRDVGRGAAHVEGDDLLQASRGSGAHRADDSAGRAGENGILAVQQAALGESPAGLHELQAYAWKRLGDALQVAAQHGRQIGVGNRRLSTGDELDQRAHLVGDRDLREAQRSAPGRRPETHVW